MLNNKILLEHGFLKEHLSVLLYLCVGRAVHQAGLWVGAGGRILHQPRTQLGLAGSGVMVPCSVHVHPRLQRPQLPGEIASHRDG